ncbi:unnamed protein product, partial [Meganyctiphanes norvegica]
EWTKSCKSYYEILYKICTACKTDPFDIEELDITSDIKAQQELFGIVKDISSLLSQGTPVYPPGTLESELVLISVNNHSPRVLELILAAGAPLLKTEGRYSILEMAWMTTTSTTKEAVMITRQMEMNLYYELKQIVN